MTQKRFPAGRIDGTSGKLFEKMYVPATPLRLRPPYVGATDEEFQAFMMLLRERLPKRVPVA